MNRWLWIILVIALIARLSVGLNRAPIETEQGAGDSFWYWRNGDVLMSGATRTEIDGVTYDVSQLQPPPVYLMFVGLPQQFLEESAALRVVVIVQALLSTLTVFMAARIAYLLTKNDRAALVTAALIGLSPAFIIESAQITTETLYMTLLTGALLLYMSALNTAPTTQRFRADTRITVAAMLFGAAVLTRAVLLAFPLALVVYWIVIRWRREHWRAVGHALVFAATFAGVVLTWTAYNIARWDRFVIAGEGIAAFLYIGATGWDDPATVDQRLLDSGAQTDANAEITQQAYTNAAVNAIGADVMGYLSRRVGELAGAALQPHGTAFFPGESLRDLAVNWARDDRSLNGLIDVMRGDQFAIKALLYVFHYGTIVLGIFGAWRMRSRWRLTLVLLGLIAYTLAVHLVFLALPRYLFPTLIAWAVLAGGIFVRIQQRTQGDDGNSGDRIVVR